MVHADNGYVKQSEA